MRGKRGNKRLQLKKVSHRSQCEKNDDQKCDNFNECGFLTGHDEIVSEKRRERSAAKRKRSEEMQRINAEHHKKHKKTAEERLEKKKADIRAKARKSVCRLHNQTLLKTARKIVGEAPKAGPEFMNQLLHLGKLAI